MGRLMMTAKKEMEYWLNLWDKPESELYGKVFSPQEDTDKIIEEVFHRILDLSKKNESKL
jgi:hypothetical protein